MGSFQHKIRMAYALGIIGNETKENLGIIRRVRNTFAHAASPVSFSTNCVHQACDLLAVPANYRPSRRKTLSGREKYRIVCEVIEHNLISWGAIFDMRLTHGTITVPLPAHSSVWAMKPPFHKTFKGCLFVVPPIWRHRLSKRPRSGCDHLGSDFNFFALFRFAMRGAHGAPASRRPVGPTLHLVLPMSTV